MYLTHIELIHGKKQMAFGWGRRGRNRFYVVETEV